MNDKTCYVFLRNTAMKQHSQITNSIERFDKQHLQFLEEGAPTQLDDKKHLVYKFNLECPSVTYTSLYGLGDNKYLIVEELNHNRYKVTFILVYTGRKSTKVITGIVRELDYDVINTLFAALVMNRVEGIVNRNNTICQSALQASGLLETAIFTYGSKNPVLVSYDTNKPGYICLKGKRGNFYGEYCKCPKQLFNQ